MEKINVADLLKGCPKGIELYSPLCGDCKLYDVNDYGIRIETPNKDTLISLHHDGRYCVNGEIMLFPKGKTTWEGFHKPFEPGDIVITDNNEHTFIYSGENDRFWECYCGVYCGTRDVCINSRVWSDKSHNIRLATEEEKEELFKVIKDNGYEWNAETKTLKKSIKVNFKDGDIVYIKTNVFEHIFIFKVNKDDNFIEGYASLSGTGLYLDGYPVCETNDVKEIRLATEQEKEKLFDALKPTGYHWNSETKTLEYLIKPKFKPGDKIRSKNKKDEYFHILHVDEDKHKYVLNIKGYCLEFKDQDNYELVPNKFDITTLKPFDKVLVRDTDKGRWDIQFYEGYDNENKTYPYRTLGGTIYKQCIPYKGNEDLAGFVKECSNYYKTWINEEE